LAFSHELSAVISAGIVSEPPSKTENATDKEPAEKIPPSKKGAVELKDRKRLAKRIIKAVQPQLEIAVRAEADVSNKPVEKQLKELDSLLEASMQSRRDSLSGSLGESASLADADAEHEVDDEMVIDSHTRTNGVEHTNGHIASEDQDNGNETIHVGVPIKVDVQDVDAPNEEIDDADVFAPVPTGTSEADDPNDIITVNALAEVDGNVSQMPNHSNPNGIKASNTPPDTNGYVSAPEHHQPSPPTPPVSNGGIGTDHVETLTNGGIPWYLKDFYPEGTSVLQEKWTGRDVVSRMSEELSDMDEDELKGLGADVDERDGEVAGIVGATPRTKKGKAKRRWKGFR